MKYTLETKIKFECSIEESIETMEELGFTLEELSTKNDNEIEKELEKLFLEWKEDNLYEGWEVVEDNFEEELDVKNRIYDYDLGNYILFPALITLGVFIFMELFN